MASSAAMAGEMPCRRTRGGATALSSHARRGIVSWMRPRLCNAATSQSEISDTSSGDSALADATTSCWAGESRLLRSQPRRLGLGHGAPARPGPPQPPPYTTASRATRPKPDISTWQRIGHFYLALTFWFCVLTHLLKNGNVVLWLSLFLIRRVVSAKPRWQ